MTTDHDVTERSGTEQAIMEATYRALRRHGYADLSIKNIGEEFEKSTSLVYYHYDDKDDLLLSFLDFVLDEFVTRTVENPDGDPETRLYGLVDRILPREFDDELREFHGVMLELRAQAARDPDYRAQFTGIDDLVVATAAEIVRDGVRAGQFRDVDPEPVAERLVALLFRGMDVRVTTDRATAVETLRAAARDLVDDLAATDGATPDGDR
jgi:AcrR family transcriptional regulator